MPFYIYGYLVFSCPAAAGYVFQKGKMGEFSFCGMRGYQAEVLIELCFSQRAIMQAIKMY